jgi:hypothetical protein
MTQSGHVPQFRRPRLQLRKALTYGFSANRMAAALRRLLKSARRAEGDFGATEGEVRSLGEADG